MKNRAIITNKVILLSEITPQATSPLAIAVPNIFVIFKTLLNFPLCLLSTYLLDSASVDGLESPINPIASINTIIFWYILFPSNIIYALIILNTLEIRIHFAIPNREDILTKSGLQNPVIPNRIP